MKIPNYDSEISEKDVAQLLSRSIRLARAIQWNDSLTESKGIKSTAYELSILQAIKDDILTTLSDLIPTS